MLTCDLVMLYGMTETTEGKLIAEVCDDKSDVIIPESMESCTIENEEGTKLKVYLRGGDF